VGHSIVMMIHRRKGSSHQAQESLFSVKVYCNMFQLMYQEPLSG